MRMATIGELWKQGIRKIRLPHWNEFAYIEFIPAWNGKYYAPWGKLYDIRPEEGDVGYIGRVPLWDNDDRWEPYQSSQQKARKMIKPNQMEIHREWRIVVQPSLPEPSLSMEFQPTDPVNYETLKWPPWLQEQIMHFRNQFTARHKRIIPNVLILQDSYLVSAQFDREYLMKDPKPQWVQDKIKELYEKLRDWQGQMLFEWYGLKVYNRHHVIGNRDLPMIFLEVHS